MYGSRNLFTLRVNCDVAVMCRIPTPNRSPSFEVSAIFTLPEIEDIFAHGKFYCLWCCHLVKEYETSTT